MKSKVFLIVGNTGAGKSTYASKLAKDENSIVYSGDEWFKTLFFPDLPNPSTYEWALERTERIEVQILKESLKVLSKSINIILDIGFFKKTQRQRVLEFYHQNKIETEIHYLDIDKQTRWLRVDERNKKKTATFEFEVSREIFEFCETIYEPLDEVELLGKVFLPS